MHWHGLTCFILSNLIKSNGLTNIFFVMPSRFTLYWCQYIIYDDRSSAINNLTKTLVGGKGI